MFTRLVWSDDRLESLKKLWEAGLSASQIAGELNITRNAVIGKVHRLGLGGRAKSPSSAAPRPRKARPARVAESNASPKPRSTLAELLDVDLEPDLAAFDTVVPMSQRLSLSQLDDTNCHWPVGDPQSPDFFFCGGLSLTGLPYCAQHSRVAYQPAADRRRSPARLPA